MTVDRIQIDPRVCAGQPVIKGTRIPVAVIMELLAVGETWESVLEGYPELNRQDIAAALHYAGIALERPEFDLVEV